MKRMFQFLVMAVLCASAFCQNATITRDSFDIAFENSGSIPNIALLLDMHGRIVGESALRKTTTRKEQAIQIVPTWGYGMS